MAKKNVLVIISKLNNGGAEKIAIYLAEKLANKYNVHILVSDLKLQDYKCSVPIIELPIMKIIRLKTILRINEIKKIKRELNIDYTISLGFKSNFFNVISRVNDKVIVSVVNMIRLKELKKQDFLYKHFVLKKADVIVPVSKRIEMDLIENYKAKKRKIKTIYNFCNEKEIDELKIEPIEDEYSWIFESENVVATVGRLHYQKAQIYLLKAFKKVVKEIPDAKLIILGRGTLYDELNDYIVSEKLEKSIILLGFKQNLYKYLYKSSMFVLSSRYEGLPNSIIEAMYLSLPIVSTDCDSGPREVLEPNSNLTDKVDDIKECEYGILFPNIIKNNLTEEEYIDYIYKSIVKVLKDKKLKEKYSKLSKKRVEDFRYDKIIDEWIEIMER